MHNALGIPAPADTNNESSGSFFDKLFSSNENTDTDIASTEEIVETNEENLIVENKEEEVIPQPEIKEEETDASENNWAESDTEDQKPSGGLFSAIGDFFSGENKNTDPSLTNEEETEDNKDEVLIAKVEDTAPVVEEIELAQEAETDLSQFSVHAGRRALTNNDYDEALKQFTPLAKAGDSEAQAHLGSLYYVGKGVSQDLNEAYNWYQKSAIQGNMDAQYSIGNMYLLGEGIEQNNANAARWYTLASNQGHVAAENNLTNLEKLESLNRENQLKLDALAAEQKAKENVAPIIVEKPEEVLALEETETDSKIARDDVNVMHNALGIPAPSDTKEESSGGFFDNLFSSNESTETDIASTEEISETKVVEDVEIVERDQPPIKPAQTLAKEEFMTSETNSIPEETEHENSIAATEDTQSESPGFFKSLFGDNDLKQENQVDTVVLEATEEIESIDIEPVITKDVIKRENEEYISEQDDSLTEEIIEEESIVESEEKSGGLFGFIGDMFSSEKNNDASDIEADKTEEVALLKEESAQEITTIDNTAVEELPEDVIEVTEIERLRPLATQGDQDAQYKLGALYYSGDSVKQDYSQAALWYRRAAQQGNAEAQFSLGNMFLLGEGIDQDDSQAAQWYTLAAEQGHASAIRNLDSLKKLEPTNSIPVDVKPINTGQLISLDDERAFDVSTSSDTTGKPEYEQGLAYAFGDGVPQNDRSAFNLFYEAAEKGYVLAQYKVGVAFAYGEGVRQDQKKAAEWYRKAAEQGYTIAQRNLATMYLEGKGVEQNKVQALAWYQVVANAGNAMDLHRRDMLKKELSEPELSESQALTNQISSRIINPSL